MANGRIERAESPASAGGHARRRRSALTDVPAWRSVAAVLLMLAGILVPVRVGGRLHRGAVLYTAGRLRIRQAWRGAA